MIAQTCPHADVRVLGPQTQRRMVAHDIFCVHTMVGYLITTDHYFRISNGDGLRGTEAHYGLGGIWGPDLGGGLDGKAWQWQDRAYSADANLDGWDRVISIETADNAARPIAKWTPAQLDRLVDVAAWECSREAHAKCPPSWACHQDGIPAQLIPDTKPGRRGIGYHRQGCEHSDGLGSHPGWLVAGGERWSTSIGKDCPTQARINQLEDIVIPRVQARLNQEDDVQLTDKVNISGTDVSKATGATTVKVGDALRRMYEWTFRSQRDAAIGRALAEAAAKANRPLTAAETEAVVEKAIAENVVKVDVSINEPGA